MRINREVLDFAIGNHRSPDEWLDVAINLAEPTSQEELLAAVICTKATEEAMKNPVNTAEDREEIYQAIERGWLFGLCACDFGFDDGEPSISQDVLAQAVYYANKTISEKNEDQESAEEDDEGGFSVDSVDTGSKRIEGLLELADEHIYALCPDVDNHNGFRTGVILASQFVTFAQGIENSRRVIDTAAEDMKELDAEPDVFWRRMSDGLD